MENYTPSYIGPFLVFLGVKFNEDLPLDHLMTVPMVLTSWLQQTDSFFIAYLTVAALLIVSFLLVELLVTPEPVLVPGPLRQKVPVPVWIKNFFVSLCTFAIIYFFLMWFQTVTCQVLWKLVSYCDPVSVQWLIEPRSLLTPEQRGNFFWIIIRQVSIHTCCFDLNLFISYLHLIGQTGKYKVIKRPLSFYRESSSRFYSGL